MLNHFPYITVPAFAGDVAAGVEALLRANGKYKTFMHAKAVADANRFIAAQYGLDGDVCVLCGFCPRSGATPH